MSATQGTVTGASAADKSTARARKTPAAKQQPTVEDLPSETTSTHKPQESIPDASTTPATNISTTPETPPKPVYDFLSREKGADPLGTLSFIILRLFDVFYQYNLLRHGLGAYIISFLPVASFIVPHRLPPSSSYLQLGLTPFHTIVFLLSVIAAIRQIFWILVISEQKLSPRAAVTVGGFQTLFNTINTLFSLWSRASNVPRIAGSGPDIKTVSDFFSKPSFTPAPPTSTDFTWTFYFGLVLFVAGLSIETTSELQRKVWKNRPENTGKPYAEGLFKVATHINYGGFLLWRVGYAIACSKLSWGMLVGYMFGYQFYTQGIPAIDEYLEKKYGDAYKQIKKDTEWRLLPGIY